MLVLPRSHFWFSLFNLLLLIYPSTEEFGAETSITCEEPHYYVGVLPWNNDITTVQHRFTLVNPGQSDERVNVVKAACACPVAKGQQGSIAFDPIVPARGKSTVTIRFRTNPQVAKPDIREFSVQFGRAETPEVKLTVLAKRMEAVEIFPATDVVCTASERTSHIRRLYLVSRDRKDFSVKVLSNMLKKVRLHVREVGAPADLSLPSTVAEKGKIYALDLYSRESLAVGSHLELVDIMTNHPEFKKITLNLLIMVRP